MRPLLGRGRRRKGEGGIRKAPGVSLSLCLSVYACVCLLTGTRDFPSSLPSLVPFLSPVGGPFSRGFSEGGGCDLDTVEGKRQTLFLSLSHTHKTHVTMNRYSHKFTLINATSALTPSDKGPFQRRPGAQDNTAGRHSGAGDTCRTRVSRPRTV